MLLITVRINELETRLIKPEIRFPKVKNMGSILPLSQRSTVVLTMVDSGEQRWSTVVSTTAVAAAVAVVIAMAVTVALATTAAATVHHTLSALRDSYYRICRGISTT